MEKLEKINKWLEKIKNGEYNVNNLTKCEDAIIKYGAENIFLINSDYHGLYQDDYCTFNYYNNVTGEEFTDEWSTAYAAPNYKRFKERCLALAEAEKLGLINKKIILEKSRERLICLYSNISKDINKELAINCHLEVSVSRGRKWKGTGILKNIRRTTYQYATPSFRSINPYYGKTDTDIAIIYDNDANKIVEVNYAYCVFTKYDEMIATWKNEIIDYLNEATVEDVDKLTIKIPVWLQWEVFVARYANELPDFVKKVYNKKYGNK